MKGVTVEPSDNEDNAITDKISIIEGEGPN